MNHAKLETYYRIFDASIVPVCAGGCARLTEALAARLGRKVTDTQRAELGRPAAPRRIRREACGSRLETKTCGANLICTRARRRSPRSCSCRLLCAGSFAGDGRLQAAAAAAPPQQLAFGSLLSTTASHSTTSPAACARTRASGLGLSAPVRTSSAQPVVATLARTRAGTGSRDETT